MGATSTRGQAGLRLTQLLCCLLLLTGRCASDDTESPLQQLLARLRLRVSGQTPADTSLLPKREPQRDDPLARLGVVASGQTPADTSLLPPRKHQPAKQPRRSGPASVVLLSAARPGVASPQTPANVGLLDPAPSAAAAAGTQQQGVTREESSSFKEVDGQSVRVVVGSFGYQSPEGLPVAVKYTSDEMGNQASFSIGAGTAGGAASAATSASGAAKSGPANAGGAKSGGANAGGAKSGGTSSGAASSGDRNYLPPK